MTEPKTAADVRGTIYLERTHAKVVLSKGLFAIIDLPDVARVGQHVWSARAGGLTWYAMGHVDGKLTYLHRFLMPVAELVDHINGDGLDNRRSNLRATTNSVNQQNRRPWKRP